DFRLSFTYGNYVTLTNLGPKGFQRLIDQRLSPLYVSVHATEPEVRMRLLGVPRGGDILDQLRRLTEAGIEVHTQVVLCPEWNDGPHLDRTIEDLWSLGPGILSISVVPVGLTQHTDGKPVRLLRPDEAEAALERVDQARARALRERRICWAYAADEMFFIAGRPIPDATYYDDWTLTENGVGSVRRLLDEFAAGLDDVPDMTGQHVAIVTGTRMEPIFEGLRAPLARASGARTTVRGVENTLFGPTVNTAGLLPGRDMLRAVQDAGPFDLVLLPAESLNDDAIFIDDLSLADFEARVAPARVKTGYEL